MYLQRLSTSKLLKTMPFFYILYILIKKILKILYWGRNLQGRTGKGSKPLGAEPEKGRNLCSIFWYEQFFKTKLGFLEICWSILVLLCIIFPSFCHWDIDENSENIDIDFFHII